MQTYTFIVEDNHSDKRLDVFVSDVLPDCPSRNFVQQMIARGLVTVNGEPKKSHAKVTLGDEVVVTVPQVAPLEVRPEKIPLDFFYEDEDLAVVQKPSGMTVHPAPGCPSGTLVNALAFHCQTLSSLNDALRPGIVHRLDRDTSGLMVVAKNNFAHARLAEQFAAHTVKKEYRALVENVIAFDEGIIDAPLGRHPRSREKRAVVYDNAKEAQTRYKVLERFARTTLVALYPATGRTHQIRVHLAHLGHPVLGDEKYGKKTSFPRLALHAQGLGFVHPRAKVFWEFFCRTPEVFALAEKS